MESTPRASRTLAAVMLALLGLLLVLEGVALAMALGAGLGRFALVVLTLLATMFAFTIAALVAVAYKLINAHRHVQEDACQCGTCGVTFRLAGPPSAKAPAPRPTPREMELSSLALLAGGPVLSLVSLFGLVVTLTGEAPGLVAVVLGVGVVLGVAALVGGLRLRKRAVRGATAPHRCSCRWCGAPR